MVNGENVSAWADHKIGRNRMIEYKLEIRRKISRYEKVFNSGIYYDEYN